jgi:Zn-dependent M28 family amino/carboxypeptidase
MILMPGRSYRGTLPPLTEAQAGLAARLRADVETIAGDIGERNTLRPAALAAAARLIEGRLESVGYGVRRHEFQAEGITVANLEALVPGGAAADQIVVVGAHYDSVWGCPAANDNASGVAAGLALAEAFAGRPASRTLRFVFFANEEPPFFQTEQMGSLVYARECRSRGERVVAMLSLETIGYYSDREGSQRYPPPLGLLYPSRGDFIGFVGNVASRWLVRRAVGAFRRHAKFPSEGGALPAFFPGVGWSDHWAFWEQGYPAVMVTDTAPFRYPHYHLSTDTPQHLDYQRMARVVEGLQAVVRDLVQ